MDRSRFGRSYQLLIETNDNQTFEILPPFTVEFDIIRNILTSSNVCSIRINNLGELRRNQIAKNKHNLFDAQRKIVFRAGYGPNMPVIFTGNITIAASSREGSDFVTFIECFDAGFAMVNSHSSVSFPANTTKHAIIQKLLSDLQSAGVDIGAVSDFQGSIDRAAVYNGNTVDILKEISNGKFFVDNMKAHLLKDEDGLPGDIDVINARAGLIGSPRLEQTTIEFDMIFEPRLKIGQVIQLESSTIRRFNGLYKVAAVKHHGSVSAVTSAATMTSVTVYLPIGGLKILGG